MLWDDGQIEAKRVDVADLCLGALRERVRSRRLRLNTNPGDLFVTREVALLVAPVAVDVLTHGSVAEKGEKNSTGQRPSFRSLLTLPCIHEYPVFVANRRVYTPRWRCWRNILPTNPNISVYEKTGWRNVCQAIPFTLCSTPRVSVW